MMVEVDLLTPSWRFPNSLSEEEIVERCGESLGLSQTDKIELYQVTSRSKPNSPKRFACLLSEKFNLDFIEWTLAQNRQLNEKLSQSVETILTLDQTLSSLQQQNSKLLNELTRLQTLLRQLPTSVLEPYSFDLQSLNNFEACFFKPESHNTEHSNITTTTTTTTTSNTIPRVREPSLKISPANSIHDSPNVTPRSMSHPLSPHSSTSPVVSSSSPNFPATSSSSPTSSSSTSSSGSNTPPIPSRLSLSQSGIQSNKFLPRNSPLLNNNGSPSSSPASSSPASNSRSPSPLTPTSRGCNTSNGTTAVVNPTPNNNNNSGSSGAGGASGNNNVRTIIRNTRTNKTRNSKSRSLIGANRRVVAFPQLSLENLPNPSSLEDSPKPHTARYSDEEFRRCRLCTCVQFTCIASAGWICVCGHTNVKHWNRSTGDTNQLSTSSSNSSNTSTSSTTTSSTPSSTSLTSASISSSTFTTSSTGGRPRTISSTNSSSTTSRSQI